jgi:glyoxylase-like metal-dependent hydrolase (beta-lactamase superfamily II)
MLIGDVRLRLISDGTSRVDGGSLFGLVPKVLWERVHAPDRLNRVLLERRSLLIETGQLRILVDTGCGQKPSSLECKDGIQSDTYRLITGLADLGVQAVDVDLVVNTHLHQGHSGGNTICGTAAGPIPAFPNATYCVQRLELADASLPNERTRAVYQQDSFRPLEEAGQLRILSGDTRLCSEVQALVMPGHTRSHQCVAIHSSGRTAIYLGDVAPWPIFIERLSWVSGHDVEPLVSIATKRRLARWAIENRVLLIFQHHTDVEAGYLCPTNRPDRFRLEPVELG